MTRGAARRRSRGTLGRAGRHALVCLTGIGLLAAATRSARHQAITEREDRYFRASNALPDPAERPLAAVMQLGSLGGAWGVGAAFAVTRRPRPAVLVTTAGTAAWGAAKLVKRRVGRGRPSAHLEDVLVRGHPQTGLGFPSGHTAVAVTTAVVASRYVGWPWATALSAAAAATGIARMYVGAHLPLDVVGGIGVGFACGGLASLVDDLRP